jgi:WD40 repeat protein/predicted Ser/Thr protein kinase
MANEPSTVAYDPEDRLHEAVASFEEAVDGKLSPDPEEWLARYPDVAERLREHFAAAGVLKRLAESPPPEAPAPVPTVKGYRILGPLGAGGMGMVYRAVQQGPNRVVALKVIRPDRLDGFPPAQRREAIQRFVTEARAAARLGHEGIIEVFEVGEVEGRPFYSMRYVEGASLADLIAGGPLEPRRAAAYLERVAWAVHEAHRHGILHRDLKPENILVESATDRVFVADFGLAKLAQEDHEGTRTGAVLGTPAYMSPEAAQDSARVTMASDVYSLGATLYALLTGRSPFPEKEPPAVKLRRVIEEEPVPPRRLRPEIARDLETICLKCLQKDPSKRYASAEELAGRLRLFLEGRPIPDRPTGKVERLWRWCRRNPALAAALTVAAALLLAGVTISTWQAVRATNAEAVAIGQRNEARAASAKLRLARDELQTTLYTAQASLTQHAWDANDLVRVRDLLRQQVPAEGERDLRGFEWYFWDRRAHAERTSVAIPDLSPLQSGGPSLNPDGMRVVGWARRGDGQGRSSRRVTVWDAATGKALVAFDPEAEFPGQQLSFSHPTFDSTGSRILLRGTGNPPPRPGRPAEAVFTGWETSTGKKLFAIRDTYEEMFPPMHALSPNGKRFAASVETRPGKEVAVLLKVWDTTTGQELPVGKELPGRVWAIAFSPDGARLAAGITRAAVGPRGSEVKIWASAGGKEALTLGDIPGAVSAVVFSPDGKSLATGSGYLDSSYLSLFDAATGETRFHRRMPADRTDLVFSPDGRRLACYGAAGVTVRDASTGRALFTVKGHPGRVRGAAFSGDGERLITAGEDRTVRTWAATASDEPIHLKAAATPLYRFVFDARGTRAAAIGSPRGSAAPSEVRVWDVAGRQLFGFVHPFEPGTESETNWPELSLSADGGRVASIRTVVRGPIGAGRWGKAELRVWDVDTGKQLFLVTSEDLNHQIALSPNGTRVVARVSAKGKYSVKMWDVANGREVQRFSAKDFPTALAFSRDGDRLAAILSSLDSPPVLKVWEAATGRKLWTVQDRSRHGSIGNVAVCFSPDGRRIAWSRPGTTGSSGGLMPSQVSVNDAATGKELFRLKGHAGPVAHLAFSPDGRRLVSVEMSPPALNVGQVKVWDARTGSPLLTLAWEGTAMRSASFSGDGHRLYTAGLVTSDLGCVLKPWDGTPR